jgi:hypothetical protein
MKSALSTLRLIHVLMLISILVIAYLPEHLHPHPDHPPQPMIYYALTFIAVLDIVLTFVFRRLMITRAEKVLAVTPEDGAALNRWRTGQLLSICMCVAVALYGLVLRFIGFSLGQVIYFYVVAVVLMLYVTPRLPDSYNG